MFSKFGKLILVTTSASPIILVWAVVLWRMGENLYALIAISLSVILFLVCLWLINYAQKKYAAEKFKIQSVEVADREIFSFLAAYLLPLVFGQETAPDFYILATVMIVFGAVISVSYNYHFNPLLSLSGWHFYRVKNTSGMSYVLITRKTIRNVKLEIEAVHLTDYLMLEK